MAHAFVFLNVEAGAESTVLKQLKEIANVEEAYIAYGVYDLIVKVKADTMESLKETVTNNIREIKLVRSTLTLLTIGE